MIDDHEIVICGLQHIINTSLPRIKQTDTATSGTEALEKIRRKAYDLYILDIEMPDISGFEVLEHIRNEYPKAKIIVNTMHDEVWYYKKIESYNVDAVVYKSVDTGQIVTAINTVLDGGKYFSKPPKSTPPKRRKTSQYGKELSKRELEVLRCIAQGKNTAEIAAELCISVNTVETHHRHLNEKLEATNMATLIMHAVTRGLLPIG